MKKGLIIAALTASVLMFSSCTIRFGDNDGFSISKKATIIDTKNEKNTIELENTKRVKLDIDFGVGELNMTGGSDKLMDGEFIYNVEEWKPQVNLTKGETAELKISQPHSNVTNVGNRVKYEWNLKFNEKIPFEIDADMGVGKNELDLRKMNLERLDLDLGVGDTTLDVSGSYNHDVDIKIDGGVGKITVYVPKNINIKIDADKGVGNIDINGFVKNNSTYSYESKDSKYTMTMKINVGVGNVKVIQR